MENSKITALVDLGILCRGEAVETHGDGGADRGPYQYTGHNQFCRYENPYHRFPFLDPALPAYDFFQPGLSMETAVERTRLVVMLGAADSEELRLCLARPDTIVILFEPDDRVLISFLDSIKLGSLNRQGVFIFTGDPYTFNPALQEMLPSALFMQGTPAFFQTDRIRESYGEWAGQVVEYLEILHFRHSIYRISGQFLCRAKPLRKIKRDLIYDQQLHAYENIGDFLRCPDIGQLRNRFHGHSAILVAAGPDLNSKLDYIKRNRNRAVVISVNNALKPLVEAGIKPHFAVINDISIIAGKVFQHIKRQPGTILVAQCLSDLGGDRFIRKFLFGNHLPNVFGFRQDLDLHGSVISTAFSLARHMGCARSVIVGGQLASDNPWGLNYAKGTVKEAPGEAEKPLIGKFPQLYPVPSLSGGQLYTTPNFRDAALWLSEVIRLSDMTCYNTSESSILYGRGISFESEPELPDLPVNRIVADIFKSEPLKPDYDVVMQHIAHDMANWTNIQTAARDLLKDRSVAIIARGAAILNELDGSNVTNLLERFEDFNSKVFYRLAFQGNVEQRRDGYIYYYEYLEQMSSALLDVLAQSAETCRRLAREAGTPVQSL